jgi:hypothetical protein
VLLIDFALPGIAAIRGHAPNRKRPRDHRGAGRDAQRLRTG